MPARLVARPSGDDRPVTAKGQNRLDKLLDAAEQLVQERGLEGVTLRSVADAVGISLANLQYYTPTRADLFAAMFRRVAATFEAGVEAAVTSDDPMEQLEQLLRYWLGTHLEPEQPAFWHLWAFSAHDASAQDVMVGMYRPLVTGVTRLIRDADPDVSKRAAHDAAGVIASMIEGSSIFLGRGRPAGDHRRLQRAVLEAALDVARGASSK